MIKKISKTEEIKEKLRKKGKSTYLDKPEDIVAMIEMDKQLEQVRREFRIKNAQSEIDASKFFFTT